MKENFLERIEINPEIMTGKPVIKGTRMTVEFILQLLADGHSKEYILEQYPFLNQNDIKACLLFAIKQLSEYRANVA